MAGRLSDAAGNRPARSRSGLCAAGLALALLAGLPVPAQAGLWDALTGTTGRTEITRTSHGVAHIRADSDEGLAYGLGYANAQDNVCAIADQLVTARGERSLWFGPEASGSLGERTLPNRVLDLFVRAQLGDARLARAWQQASPQAHALERGVVEGFNRYLDDAKGHLPAECEGQPWLQPMTVAEFRRLAEMVMIEDGLGAWADAVVGAQPPREDGVPARPLWLPAPPIGDADAPATRQRPAGSNAFAFGRESSLSGQGLLLANPHLPWQGPNRLWQVHLTEPGELDVMGVALGVLPIVAIGFNESVAWSHTASPAPHFTLHELRLVPGDPRAYVIDGQVEPMTSITIRIFERKGDGGQVARDQTFWFSRYGPIVVAPSVGLEWTPNVAYALQDAASGNARLLDTWRAMAKAVDVGSLRAALDLQGLPWMATVATDRNGQVLFADTSAVPPLDAARSAECAPSRESARIAARTGLVILDGTRGACNWLHDGGIGLPGAAAARRVPMLERSDWVQSTGDSAWLANPAAPITGLSPLFGRPGAPQSLATRAAVRGIARRLEGRDDLALHQRMGPDQLAALLYSHTNLAAGMVLDDLLAVCPDAPTEASKAGCAALAAWDRTDNAGARGAHVFREFWRRARTLPDLWRVPFDVRDPVYTPFGLAIGPHGSKAVRQAVFETLGLAVHAVRDAGVGLDAPLGTLQTQASPAGPVPLGGGEAFEGVLDVLSTLDVVPLARTGYRLDTGPSYIGIVSFEPTGVDARAVLVYGQSSRVGSPRHFDQLPAYAAQRWYRLPFRAEDVAADRVGRPLELHFRPGADEEFVPPMAGPSVPGPASPSTPVPGPGPAAASAPP
ncbi:MAG TPA: penicillin acylase family protein [Burkholderiaceae bacterium]|nr:penicillin acylase family protein [Burkholderiaceae bacterium]